MESLNVGNAGFPVVENGARAGVVPVESDQRVRFVDDEQGVIQRMQMLRTLNDRHLLGISREHLEETRAVAAQRSGVFHHDMDAIARTGDEKTAQDLDVFGAFQTESDKVFVKNQERCGQGSENRRQRRVVQTSASSVPYSCLYPLQ